MACLNCVVRKNRGIPPKPCDCGKTPSLKDKVARQIDKLASEELARRHAEAIQRGEFPEKIRPKLTPEERERRRKESQARWRQRNREGYNAYMRDYMKNRKKSGYENKKERQSVIFASPHKEAGISVRTVEAGL